MRKALFNKHIDKLTEEDLRSELLLLFDKIDAVKDYYRMELGTKDERKKKFDSAKKDIEAKYKTKSIRKPRRPRIQKIKKILSDLKKISVFNYELIDVYLFDVECAIEFARTYDYFSQVLFNNILNSFEQALTLIEQNMMSEQYRARCITIVERSRFILELQKAMETELKKVY